jgi:hypothetical protein
MAFRLARTLVLTAALFFQAPPASQEPSDADWDWVNARFGAVLRELLPFPSEPGNYIAFRSYRDLYPEVLEFSFVISSAADGKLSAIVRVPDGISIYKQIMTLHRQNPTATIEAIKQSLKIKEWSTSDGSCPTLRQRYRGFQHLRFTAPEIDIIVLHPMIYQFKVSGGGGDMDLVTFNNKHPLVSWAGDTRSAFEACKSKPK